MHVKCLAECLTLNNNSILAIYYLLVVVFNFLSCVCVLVSQSCPTLCDPMDCNLPGSSVHGILQVRMLEWVAVPFSGIFPT